MELSLSVYLFVHLSIHLSNRPAQICGCCNSATTRQIHSKSCKPISIDFIVQTAISLTKFVINYILKGWNIGCNIFWPTCWKLQVRIELLYFIRNRNYIYSYKEYKIKMVRYFLQISSTVWHSTRSHCKRYPSITMCQLYISRQKSLSENQYRNVLTIAVAEAIHLGCVDEIYGKCMYGFIAFTVLCFVFIQFNAY